jgi:hypothetical protein
VIPKQTLVERLGLRAVAGSSDQRQDLIGIPKNWSWHGRTTRNCQVLIADFDKERKPEWAA